MLFSVEQAFVGRDEKRAPLKMPAWEARVNRAVTTSLGQGFVAVNMSMTSSYFHRKQKGNRTRRNS